VSQQAILSVNSGSSTIKFALYPVQNKTLVPAILSGVLEGLEPGGKICLRLNQQNLSADSIDSKDEETRFAAALQWLQSQISLHAGAFEVCAVAHRIVHGGGHFADSCIVTADVLQTLRGYEHLAPLHQPHNLDGVAAFAAAYPCAADCLF
jgi:acetate kinase